jgi:hypothetical protein
MKDIRQAFVLAAGLVAAGMAHARIYGFIDEQGVAHFSNVPNDHRYKLFMRTPDDERVHPRGPGSNADNRLAATAKRLPLRRQAYRTQIADIALALRLDAALVHAVIAAESGYDPKARSDKGAMGLMQLMPDTARRYCVKDPYDPAQNLRGGSQYLRDLLVRYKNDVKLALAAYNAGEEAVAKHGNRIPPYPETLEYVPRVMGLYEQYRNSGEFRPAAGLVKAVAPALVSRRCDVGLAYYSAGVD